MSRRKVGPGVPQGSALVPPAFASESEDLKQLLVIQVSVTPAGVRRISNCSVRMRRRGQGWVGGVSGSGVDPISWAEER